MLGDFLRHKTIKFFYEESHFEYTFVEFATCVNILQYNNSNNFIIGSSCLG